MKYGLYLTTAVHPTSTEQEVISNSLEYARYAEEKGFESVWVLEHHFTKYGICSSPNVMASFILGACPTIKVGTAINIIPLEHPVRLAEQVSLLDRMSEGRFMLGIGRGVFDRDFEVFDFDVHKSRETTKEWYRLMREAWTEGRVGSTGELISFPDVPVYPTPYTLGGPQVFNATNSPQSVQWSAEQGLPMLIQHDIEEEELVSHLEYYNDVAQAHGHDVDTIEHTISLAVLVDEDQERALERAHYFMNWWDEEMLGDTNIIEMIEKKSVNDYSWLLNKWKEAVRKGETSSTKRTQKILRLNPIGTPEYCAEVMNRRLSIPGIKRVILGFECAGSRAETIRSMELFRTQVEPLLDLELALTREVPEFVRHAEAVSAG